MIGSINGWEWMILAVVVLLVVGPERLPEYARQLGRLVREVKRIATGATERVREELGPEIDDLRQYDPRQYDPRRIIRDALADDDAGPTGPPTAGGDAARPGPTAAFRPGGRPAFDDEAT
ncbi:sec-independent protein translocase protein TatB [Salana multivorans]|uniref:Sec-independent protein translocase protein TatB n=1 Tax=Salana multivorans TaxID=120377 RepID=A0A3N2DCJ2_9MICO|nr:twin-arginine translocase TatA/TatE family subunit [Salana multivorans]ROR97500.1 sec-independent protein translocase protein TatB [Salana multivorans]